MANEVRILVSADDKASGVLRDVDKTAGGLSKTLGGALKIGALAGAAGISGLGAVLISSVKEAMGSQRSIAQLDAVLTSTRGAAGLTKQQILNMAAAFQKQTTFSDEAVLSAQNMLLTFKEIKGPQFEGATQAVLDMATAMGTDVVTASIQVGKALNDPIQGVTALRRVGVQLTDQQEEQIKVMMEAGDVMGAQNIILGELSSQFGGSAAAAADTFGGRMAQLKNALSEVQEVIGMALLPILTTLAKGLAAFLLDHRADIERFIQSFKRDIVPAV